MTRARAQLQRYYELLDDGKLSEAVGLFDSEGEVLWSIPGRGEMAGKYETIPAILDSLERFHSGKYGVVDRPVHAICAAPDGEHACVQYLLRMKRGEEVCRVVAIDAWHVRDSGLAEAWTFFETPYQFDEWTSR